MRRFEQVTPQGTRFWEFEIVGSELTWRSGKVGQSSYPDERTETYRNAAEARREAGLLLEKKLASGFVEIVEKSIAADQEDKLASGDEATWLVFADQLQLAGDPRGELIALQHSLGKKRTARKQVDAFVHEHAGHLLGSLEEYEKQLDLWWKNGFIDDAKLFCKAGRYHRVDETQRGVDQLLPLLFGHESSRFLRTLRLGWPEPDSDSNYEAAVEALVAHPWPRHLRNLVVGDFSSSAARAFVVDYENDYWLNDRAENDLWPELRTLGPLAARCGALETLRVRANLRQLGRLDLPNLRELEISGQHLYPALFDELRGALLPSLTGLVLEAARSRVDPESLAIFASGKIFPKLTSFGLNGFDRSAVEVVAASPRLPQLKVVDLSGNHLGDADVAFLKTMPFGHLEKLVLRNNYFGKAAVKDLKSHLPKADLANQRTRQPRRQRDDRYDEVEE